MYFFIYGIIIWIMQEIKVTSSSSGQKIEKFVKKYLSDAPLGFIYKAFRKKDIKINGHWVKKDAIVKEGDIVRIYVSDKQMEDFKKPRPVCKKDLPYHIVYEDKNVLIIDKPAGVLVYGDKVGNRETLGNAVLDYLYFKGEFDPNSSSFIPSPAHRLDRNTSGLIIYGKNDAGLKELTDLFKERKNIAKYYLTLVKGDVSSNGKIDKPLYKDSLKGRVYIRKIEEGGKSALTKYKVINRYGEFTLLEAELCTGRTHQLRVHFASIGHPIIGDDKYGDFSLNKKVEDLTGLDGQFLHAYKIKFGELNGVLSSLSNKEFMSPLSEKYTQIIEKLTK